VAPDETSTLLELYKTAVEMADRTSARRAGANSFFLTLNTALAAVVGIVSAARTPPPGNALPLFDAFGLLATSAAGIVLALVWWLLLRYYRRLNAAKFQVIHKIEERLPARPYTDEWAILRPPPEAGGGDYSRFRRLWRRAVTHREATVVEQVVPFVFVGIYLALGLRVLKP
jgi:hypothetical protein